MSYMCVVDESPNKSLLQSKLVSMHCTKEKCFVLIRYGSVIFTISTTNTCIRQMQNSPLTTLFKQFFNAKIRVVSFDRLDDFFPISPDNVRLWFIISSSWCKLCQSIFYWHFRYNVWRLLKPFHCLNHIKIISKFPMKIF